PVLTCRTSDLDRFACAVEHHELPPFPTRRSSDLESPVAQARDDPALDDEHRVFDLGLVAWLPGTRRDDRHVVVPAELGVGRVDLDRKSTRLNSSHVKISYAVFCLKKKRKHTRSNS